jgi:hypothetical protein
MVISGYILAKDLRGG